MRNRKGNQICRTNLPDEREFVRREKFPLQSTCLSLLSHPQLNLTIKGPQLPSGPLNSLTLPEPNLYWMVRLFWTDIT